MKACTPFLRNKIIKVEISVINYLREYWIFLGVTEEDWGRCSRGYLVISAVKM
jgi:hypothetical protein